MEKLLLHCQGCELRQGANYPCPRVSHTIVRDFLLLHAENEARTADFNALSRAAEAACKIVISQPEADVREKTARCTMHRGRCTGSLA